MTQYAQFNPALSPAPVTGWYDTDFATYPNLPPASDLFTLTSAQWTEHMANPSGWAIQNGALVAYTAPAPTPTLARQASAAINAGLTLTLSGSLTLAATAFPCDPITTGKIGAVITTLAVTGAFPGGATSYPLKDASGDWHTFDAAQYKTVAGGIAAYVAALDLIADGNPMGATALPSSSVSLVLP